MAHNPKTADRADFGVQLITPEGDKDARLYAIQNLFECGLIYAPAEPTGGGDYLYKDWADKVIEQCQHGSKGQHDDLADAMAQAIIHLRTLGLAQLPDEDELEHIDDNKYKRVPPPMYPAMGPAI